MDTLTLTLAVALGVAIIGQLTLPVWGGWLRARRERQARQEIARLLETAADRQLQHFGDRLAKLGNKGGGDE